jgi:pimeloyl-ACP methyl ester carboxylesterase
MPCLRLDAAGTGNAADGPEDPEHGAVPAWQASLEQAIEQLCRTTGVTRVVLMAVRGATLLAAPVAARHPQVRALVGLAPVLSGRTMLREWRALAAIAALREEHDDGALEVAGVFHSAATLRALGALSVPDLAWPVDKPVWLVDRDDLPAAARWAGLLQAQGVKVAASRCQGLSDMLLEPHRQRVPQAALDEVAEGLQAWAATLPAREHAAAPGRPPAEPRAGEWLGWAEVAPSVREQVWCVDGPDGQLYGVLTEPAPPCQPQALLLLPNTGAVHHVGNHRLYVQMARALAAQGCRVVRVDLSGLGESPARPGEASDVVYGRHALEDLAAVVQAARAQWPTQRISMLGLCAGGYHALRSAVQGLQLDQVIVVNPLVYHWHDGMTLDAHAPRVQEAYYRARWRSISGWKRLLTGRSDLRQLQRVVARGLWRSLKQMPSAVLRLSRRTGAVDDLNADLLAASQQGVRLHFVFSENEPGWPALQTQGRQALKQLQATGTLTVSHVPRADHTFTTALARQRLLTLAASLMTTGR